MLNNILFCSLASQILFLFFKVIQSNWWNVLFTKDHINFKSIISYENNVTLHYYLQIV